MPYDVFISHTEEDQQIALAACEALEREGINCWIAPRNVARGTEWAEAIIGAIKQSRALLLIFSSNANNSHHITNEVAHASELRLRIFTFRIEQVDPIRSLEYYIDKLQWLNAFDSAPENYVPQLVADIRGFLTGPPDSPPPPPKPPIRPAIASPPKWWMWVAAGLFALVVIIVAWRYLNSPASTIVGSSPTPTPTRGTSASGQVSPVVAINPAGSPGVVVTNTVTPAPVPLKSPVSDETDPRIAKAAEILGNPDVQELAAMYQIASLASLIKKSVEHQRSIVPILTSYIQKKAVWREDGRNRPAKPPPGDIQAAISVLAGRNWGYYEGEPRLELSYADLRGVDFKGGNFDGVNLVNAHLERADLVRASFRCANLNGAYVKGIDVSRADFDGTDLRGLRDPNPSEMGVALPNRGTAQCTH